MPSRLRLTRVRACKLIHFARLSCQVNIILRASARLLRQVNVMLVLPGPLLCQVNVIRLSAAVGHLDDGVVRASRYMRRGGGGMGGVCRRIPRAQYAHGHLGEAVVLASRYMRRGGGGVGGVDFGCRRILRAQYAHGRLCDIIVWCSVLHGHVASGIRVVGTPIEEMAWGLVTRRGLTRDAQVLVAAIAGTEGAMWRPAICINEVLVRAMVTVGARHGKPRQQWQNKIVTEGFLSQDEESCREVQGPKARAPL